MYQLRFVEVERKLDPGMINAMSLSSVSGRVCTLQVVNIATVVFVMMSVSVSQKRNRKRKKPG